jgi:hypothetical protein
MQQVKYFASVVRLLFAICLNDLSLSRTSKKFKAVKARVIISGLQYLVDDIHVSRLNVWLIVKRNDV